MKLRFLALVFAAGAIGGVHADWTATIIHPSGALLSEAKGCNGSKQAGTIMITGALRRAGIWSGTAASWVSLHPASATESFCEAAGGTKQVGFLVTGTTFHAVMWSGTAASKVDLHPAGASNSYCEGTDGTTQVGDAVVGNVDGACKWSGTAASWVNLHPASASESIATAVSGSKQVGYATVSGTTVASLWSGTAASWINLNPAGSNLSRANAISGNLQGGHARFGTVFHAGIWSGTVASFVDLHPTGATDSSVNGFLGNMEVGYYGVGDNGHACYWTGTAASMVDLHSKLPANYNGSQADAAGTDGVYDYIVGLAFNSDNSEYEAVVWKRPVHVTYSFTLNKATVAGANSVQGTITLDSAPVSPIVFTTYDNSSLVTTPATVTVAAGTTVKNFQITVTAVTSPINTTIYAKLGTTIKSQPLTLAPLIPTALSFTPNPVVGGHPTSCKVVINGVAGPGGRTIAIIENSPYATAPTSIVVPAGASSVTFNITTIAVTAVKNVTVTARVSAGEKSGTFRINP